MAKNTSNRESSDNADYNWFEQYGIWNAGVGGVPICVIA